MNIFLELHREKSFEVLRKRKHSDPSQQQYLVKMATVIEDGIEINFRDRFTQGSYKYY